MKNLMMFWQLLTGQKHIVFFVVKLNRNKEDPMVVCDITYSLDRAQALSGRDTAIMVGFK